VTISAKKEEFVKSNTLTVRKITRY